LTLRERKGYLYGVEFAGSAWKHGISEEDIRHAWENAIRLVEYEYDGEERLLVIGPDRHGAMLELTAVPADRPTLIIHADQLQPNRFHYLR
jgi:hypothetical protein